MLLQIIYLSKSCIDFSQAQIEQLARRCAQNNQRRDVTGVLYYQGGHFIQCLEGQDQDLVKLYAQILQDPRHHEQITLVIKPIEQRMFPKWGMGLVSGLDAEIDFDRVLPLEQAKTGAWNEQTWQRIMESFRLATLLDPYPEG